MTTVSKDGFVEFRFFRPHVSQVSVAGTFNRWRVGAMAMRAEGHGWWVARLNLPPGDYQFRYVADGQWFTDYAAHGLERIKGHWNSVLHVGHDAQAA